MTKPRKVRGFFAVYLNRVAVEVAQPLLITLPLASRISTVSVEVYVSPLCPSLIADLTTFFPAGVRSGKKLRN